MRFADKTVLVTRGGGGFGAAMCERFAAEGASVLVADIDADTARVVAARIADSGGSARAVRADVARSEDVADAVAAATTAFGGLDVIINNAGIVHPRVPTVEMDETTYSRVMDVNLKSVFLFARHGVPALAARGGGVIINVASTASLKPRPGNVIYGVSKAAVVAFTKGLAIELAPRNIRVNAILPVASRTQILLDFVGEDGDVDAELARIASAIPLARLGQPSDMAAAITWLASDDAAFVTGAALPVDGGWTAG